MLSTVIPRAVLPVRAFQSCHEQSEGDAFQIQNPGSPLNMFFSWDRFFVSVHKCLFLIKEGLKWLWPIDSYLLASPSGLGALRVDVVFGYAYIFIRLEVEFLHSCEFQGDFFKD